MSSQFVADHIGPKRKTVLAIIQSVMFRTSYSAFNLTFLTFMNCTFKRNLKLLKVS